MIEKELEVEIKFRICNQTDRDNFVKAIDKKVLDKCFVEGTTIYTEAEW